MDAFLFHFTAKQLRAVPSKYLGFLIASGHCCNELAVLLPYIIFEHDIHQSNEAETAFILTRKLTIDRILVSKIFEYNELCQKVLTSSDAASDSLMLTLRRDYEVIANAIRSAKWARILRNKISFHYDPAHGIDALEKLEDDHPMKLVAGRIKGLTLFDFAEDIVTRPTFEMAGKGDIGQGMDTIHQFIVDLVNAITSFHAKATISIFKACGMISERTKSEIREQYCGAPADARVPISISSEYLRAIGTADKRRN
jgi:hypothetical protein